ncbi:MAG: ATP-binding cassette domain-containing protein, partial [Candidatus Eremiobacteraeota bacterium]|nr:ATP-binding cassette domain-containing protein [Candidatus Eremiobacteraeota bacterium]
MNERRRADERILPYLAAAVVLFGLLARGDATLVQAGTYAAIYAVAAIGLSVLLGNVAQISIGQAGFFGVGAYTLAYATTAISWPPGLPAWIPFAAGTIAGVAFAALLGLVLGFIALRFRGHYLAMATLAFGLIAVGVFRISQPLGGSIGIQNVPFAHFGGVTITGVPAFWYAWFLVAVVALLTRNLLRGRSGRAFEAIRNDELAAEVAGVPTRRYKIAAFTYAGALAGLGGTFYAAFLGLVEPNGVSVPLSIDLLLMVVLGGAGGITGATIGASIIGIANIYGHNLENWRPVIYGALVVGIVIGFPRGLIGIVPKPKPKVPKPSSAFRPTSDAFPEHPVRTMPHASPLVVENVTKRFGGLVAVDNVSFALETGTLTSLIGPNGAGKTTLFNAICGIGGVDEGRIVVAGREVTTARPHAIARLGVGRSFQNARLFADMTVLENVAIGTFPLGGGGFADDIFGSRASRRGERAATERARETLHTLGLD